METFLVLLLGLCLGIHAQQGTTIDVVFLIDSSDNDRSANFNEEKKFALAISSQLFTPDTRIGLYTFGESAFSQFMLNTYSDFTMMRQAIQYMWYSTGDGGVDQPINFTVSDAFQQSSGDRDCYPNVLILLTHKAIQDTSARSLQTTLREKNVKVVVLNMAGAAASTELVTLAGNASLVLDVADWSALQTSVDNLLRILQSLGDDTGCGTLTDWDSWSSCSKSCGDGFQARRRECVKKDPLDKECTGELVQIQICTNSPCVDPVDGSWAFWGAWGTCTKTCGNGTQERTRQCSQPAPANGGKSCPGNNTQTRNCAEFKCPDCSKKCPAGGQLSHDCATCECSHLTLFGQLMDEQNKVVQNASIFLESRMYKPIATTGSLGRFEANGICLMNEEIYISSSTHLNKHVVPQALNSTHWTLSSLKLERLVQPVFNIQPEDKIRLVGQSLSLCCSANGKPMPTSYKWFKDNVELENVGTNGTLFIQNLGGSDSGSYKCYTETEAGVTLTEDAIVQISSGPHNTCGPPEQKLQDLPAGCYMTGDATRNTTIDVGTCGNAACMKAALHDNGSCSDYWPHHCCAEKDVRVVDISCEGFSYKISVTQSCECKVCVFKTIVSGRAFGISDGKQVQLQLGEVFVGGKVIARTSMSGFFRFDVPKGNKRVVATFHDSFFKKLSDITKIITVDEGKETYATIQMPLRPVPIPFETSNGTEIHLGGNSADKPSLAKISIPTDSIVSPDGTPFKGKVNASVHFMDPRNMDDLDMANGEFEAEAPSGQKLPLKTFGMFQFGLEDENGTQLSMNKPIKYEMEPNLFTIPVDANGQPDLSMWSYDMNKGVWVEIGKLRSETGRSKRQTGQYNKYVADITLTSIPPYDENSYQTHTERRWTGQYTNCDHSVKVYKNVTIRDIKLKQDACFVAVSLYHDLTLKSPYTDGSIEIKAYIKDNAGKSFEAAKTVRAVTNGRACVPIFATGKYTSESYVEMKRFSQAIITCLIRSLLRKLKGIH